MSLLVKLDRLIIGLILRSKLVFLISVQPHAAFIEGARLQTSVLWASVRTTFCRVCGH
jgi:hypothetical protein